MVAEVEDEQWECFFYSVVLKNMKFRENFISSTAFWYDLGFRQIKLLLRAPLNFILGSPTFNLGIICNYYERVRS